MHEFKWLERWIGIVNLEKFKSQVNWVNEKKKEERTSFADADDKIMNWKTEILHIFLSVLVVYICLR